MTSIQLPVKNKNKFLLDIRDYATYTPEDVKNLAFYGNVKKETVERKLKKRRFCHALSEGFLRLYHPMHWKPVLHEKLGHILMPLTDLAKVWQRNATKRSDI